jgi:tRNA uridine 5-carboxymethylaminomethyl modification enzyme
VDFWQEMVSEIIVQEGKAVGVKTSMGLEIRSKAVILTNGTFLNGRIHIGEKQFGGGRTGERAASGLTEQLIALGFDAGRMKTGTPPRVDGRTLDYRKMEEQPGDEQPGKFSFLHATQPLQQQKSCYITYTNKKVHQILAGGFGQSPLFNGRIQGQGPRYCPSIEDKITRFADRERHQIFVEPEGWHTVEIYVNGFSTSLPEAVQYKALQAIPGFEHAKMFRPGYAIEYDYFPATQLQSTLETRLIANLYFAGQINGTTGYEEAACQGLLAGINAQQKLKGLAPLVLSRADAYIGVLIDDLTTKATDEPYRMFTSRAEFRILLRQDNADLRLTPIGHQLGLATHERLQCVQTKKTNTAQLLEAFKTWAFTPVQINTHLAQLASAPLQEKQSVYQLLKRPELNVEVLGTADKALARYLQGYDQAVLEQAEIQLKYERYLQKEKELAEKSQRLEDYYLPADFDYDRIRALSAEAAEKLKKIRPATLGQASKISGVSPADVSILIVYLGR